MEIQASSSIVIYTDGACSGNPGPGGWGAVVAWPEGRIKELGGFRADTTNNQMELLATIQALREVRGEISEIFLFTDSVYVIRGITQWIWGWRKRGWKNAEGGEVLNRDLWEQLSKLVQERGAEGKIHWKFSRGHVGTPGNERCDEIAVAFSKSKWIDLFEGSLLQYSVAIYDFPENTELPEMKPKEIKKPAYSYLSLLGGSVVRHRQWSSCESRVKGQSGAKFKKAMSAQNELEILREWGLAPNVQIRDSEP